MSETIDREHARAVFSRQRATFKQSMQQFYAMQHEITLLVSKAASDPEARRKVARIEGEVRRSGVEHDLALEQIQKAERDFARLEGDFSSRFSVEQPFAGEQVVMNKTSIRKPRVFA